MRCAWLLLLGACGSVSDNQHLDAAVHDTGSTSDGQVDAPPPPPCDLTKPFGNPVAYPNGGINTNSTDEFGWLSPDGLTLYFDSQPTNTSNYDIYYAHRLSATSTFNQLGAETMVNTQFSEQRPVLTADMKTMFVQSNQGQTPDIWFSTRANATDSFGPLAPLPAPVNSGTVPDTHPWISGDGLTLYFASTRNGNFDLFKTTRTSAADDFGAPAAIGELDTASVEDAPTVSADGLEIFFASNRGSQRNNIWHATRSSTNDGFGTPTMVAELSTDASDDFPNWISADRCTLIYTTDKQAGSASNTGYDIWVATRPQ